MRKQSMFGFEMKIFGKLTSPLPALAVVAALLAGCTRPPDLIGVDNPAIPADSVPDLTRHQIFIATTWRVGRSGDEVKARRQLRGAIAVGHPHGNC